MLVILAAAAALATAPDWCGNPQAKDKPRNIEDRQACAAAGTFLMMDRTIGLPDPVPTCEKAAKGLGEEDMVVDPPAQLGDGYWVMGSDAKGPILRCHIVKIVGKTITMQ